MMAPVSNGDEAFSEEEYLVIQAKRCQASDPAAAKAWMITAKSLFPNNFGIQYEAYQMAKESRNVKEAALYFEEMIKTFPNESILWKEMQKLANALRSEIKNEDFMFLRELFMQLSVEIQHEMLVAVADHSEDTMEHCRLILLLLQKFPNKVIQHGIKIIETLNTAEKHSHCSPVNQFRRLLVCDVMPLILTSSNFILPPKQMFRLLQKSIEFYVCYITLPSNKDSDQTSRYEEHYKIENPIEDPWKQLFELIEIAGRKLEWELADIFSSRSGFVLSELNWQRILAILHKKPVYSELSSDSNIPVGSSSSNEDAVSAYNKEVFFCTVVIYFHCLYQFGRLVDPEWFSGSNSGEIHYILIEGIHSHCVKEDLEQPKHKKRKIEGEMREYENVPQLTVSKSASSETASILTQSFVTALKCWELLHSNHSLKKEFSRLSMHVRMEEWPWFQEFFIGSLIYQGYHKDAISRLIHLQTNTTDEFIKNKTSLQLSSCLYFIGEFSRACKHLFDVICTFSHSSSSPPASHQDLSTQAKRPGHQLHFIAFKHGEILQYCVKLLITIFKEKALQTPIKDSMSLGHLLVLVQYDWPQEEKLFLQCVDVIRKHGNFCYSLFFNYVINPDILEEFMFLTTTAGGNVSLDLLPTSTVQVGKQRAVTRGVNKGAKEDLRGAMEKQMARCEEDLDNLLITFFKQEKDLLLQNIM